MKFADLHLHTLFSDGTYTPEELIDIAADKGIAAISITDHDTLSGISSAIEIGSIKDVEVLPGVEFTAEYDGLEIHILGYLFDYQNKKLIEKLAFLKKNRTERIHKIVFKLGQMGLKLEADEVFNISAGGTPGRLHIARAMLAKGLVSSVFEAFQKYIGDKCPAYVCGFKFSPLEAIRLIKDMGGIPVLAHPYILNRDELIPQFIEYGLMGLEVYYPEHTQAMVNFYLGLAKKLGLLVTGGSDCHGLAKPEVKIGSIKLPYEMVETLKAAKEKA